MLWWFAETTLVAAILALVAGIVGRLPRVGPSARHVLWLVVLIKLVMPPVVKSPWTVSLPKEWWSGGVEAAAFGSACSPGNLVALAGLGVCRISVRWRSRTFIRPCLLTGEHRKRRTGSFC